MQRKISKIAVKMTAVLMAVVVCLPMVMSVMKQNVYAASVYRDSFHAYFDYNNGTGKTDSVYWRPNGISLETDNSFPKITFSDYPTELSTFDGWYLVDSSGNMTTTEVTESYATSGTFTAKAKWSESAYEITIPATTSIDATDKTGSVDFSGKLGKYKEMSIAVSSANGNKMVNGSYDVDYTMDKNSFSYDSDDAIKTFSDSINFEVTSEPAVAGSYKDTLTFTITAESKAIEVTIDHNDGTGTTSTAKLAIGEAVIASLPAITRDGYKLTGWTYVDASGNEVEVTEGLIYDGTITGFKANWANMSPVLQKGSDFNKNIPSTTTAIEFTTETMPSTITDYTDVSEAQDGSILAYMDGTTMKVSPKAEGATIYANEDCSNMFESKTNLISIEFNNFDTSKVTDMDSMFYVCESLTSIDFGKKFNTSEVTDMAYMFSQCLSLTSLDLSFFDTSKVTAMDSMFEQSSNIVSLNLSSFDTSAVTRMDWMFSDCSSLTELDLSNFNTDKVTDMTKMFSRCSSLTKITFSKKFNTNSTTNMEKMFFGCSNLISLDLSNFDTTNATDYDYMLGYCSNLSQITVGDKWVKNIAFPNTGVSSVGKWYALSTGTEYAYTAIPTGTADVYTVTKTTGIVFDANGGTFEDGSTINYVINGDTSTYKIAVASDSGKVFKGWATTKDATSAEYKADGSDLPTDYNGKLYAVMGEWYNDWTYELTTDGYIWLHAYNGSETAYIIPSTATIDGKTYKTKIGNWNNAFPYVQLNTGTITNLDFEKGVTLHTDLTKLFKDCTNLISLNLSNLDTSNVTNMSEMFYNCFKLTTLNLSNFNTDKVVDMSAMFKGCASLASLDVSSLNTSNVINMSNMFTGCAGLTSLDLSSFNTNAVTNMGSMFEECENLTSLNVSKFDTSNVTNMSNMFYYCECLKELDLSSFDTSAVTNMGNMFYHCTNLASIYTSNLFVTNKETSYGYNMFSNCSSLVGGNGTKYSSSHIDKTYARIDTASTPGYFTLKSSTSAASLSDETEDDTDILSVANLAKTYSSADFTLDGDSAIETASLDDEMSEEAVAYYHLNDDEDLNSLLAMNVESISIDGVMMDENVEYDDTKFTIEQSEDGVLTITSIVDEGYPSLDDWKAVIYSNIFTDINEDVTITVTVVGLGENADINGFALVEEQTSSELKEEQASPDLETETALDQEEGASDSSESAEGASVVSWQTSSELKVSPVSLNESEQASSELKAEESASGVEATATPEVVGTPSAEAE